MQYGFAIDVKRCIGCQSCAVACKIENNIPNNVWWNNILTEGGDEPDTPAGVFPDVTLDYIPMACQHCANPACVEVCPVGATYKDPETGVVHQDWSICIGCQSCMEACPYTGVRTYNEDEPAYYMDFSVGSAKVPSHLKNTVEKCTMCDHRVAEGIEPFCVRQCPARARIWGDLDDPESEIAQLVASREYKQLMSEAGTNPSVYYLV